MTAWHWPISHGDQLPVSVHNDPAAEAAKVLGRAVTTLARGHGEVAGLLLGSADQHCATRAHCLVVVLRS
ncbi:MAG: hypothetical protein ACRDZX_07170 [Acidimicrobiales bacterium]